MRLLGVWVGVRTGCLVDLLCAFEGKRGPGFVARVDAWVFREMLGGARLGC